MLRRFRKDSEEQATTIRSSRWNSSWRALRYRNYRLYFCGQAISLLGTWIQQVALGWLAYHLTSSTLLLGSVAFFSQAPQLIGAPLAGIVIDRSDRRRLMLHIQILMLLQALSLALLTELGWIQAWHILIAAVILGILSCFDAPLRHSLAVHLVDDRNDLPNAVALNSLTSNVARFVGPPLAGLAMGMTSEAACFAINGLSFLPIIGALMRIRLTPVKPVVGSFGAAMAEGLRYSRDTFPIRALLIQVAILNFLGACYVPLMPAFARDVFHGGPDILGLLLGSAGAGALGAALYLLVRPTIRGLTTAIADANALTSLGLVGFALTHQAWLGMGLLFFVGFGLITGNASANTILQAILPDQLRGSRSLCGRRAGCSRCRRTAGRLDRGASGGAVHLPGHRDWITAGGRALPVAAGIAQDQPATHLPGPGDSPALHPSGFIHPT